MITLATLPAWAWFGIGAASMLLLQLIGAGLLFWWAMTCSEKAHDESEAEEEVHFAP